MVMAVLAMEKTATNLVEEWMKMALTMLMMMMWTRSYVTVTEVIWTCYGTGENCLRAFEISPGGNFGRAIASWLCCSNSCDNGKLSFVRPQIFHTGQNCSTKPADKDGLIITCLRPFRMNRLLLECWYTLSSQDSSDYSGSCSVEISDANVSSMALGGTDGKLCP